MGGKKKDNKYKPVYAKKYSNKYNKRAKKADSKTASTIAASLCILLFIIGAFSSCDNTKHIEALEGYTQTSEQFIEEANLVDIDGFYAGTGVLNDITHVRFVAEKGGKKTDTIDVTKKFFNIVYTDDSNSPDKNLEGKVKAYKRTYKKDSDTKIHYYYVLYSSKNKIKDVGELSTD